MTAPKKRAKRVRYPEHQTTFEVVECVVDASEVLAKKLHCTLDVLCKLRETLRLAREVNRTEQRQVKAAGGTPAYLTKNDQYRHISALFAAGGPIRGIHSQVLQDVADRIDRGTKAWFKGDSSPLRFIPRKKYRSFTFTQYGSAAKIRCGRLHLSKLGDARLIGLRKLPGRIKAVTLTFKQGRWFAQFLCEVQVQHCPRALRDRSPEVQLLPDTGLDTGLARIATLADGTAFVPNKPLKAALPKLRTAQRKMSRQFKARTQAFAAYRTQFKASGQHGPLPEKSQFPMSGRLKRQIRRVAIIHTKVECVRRDQLRKVVHRLEQDYRLIAVEEHSVRFMQKNRRLSRAVSDVAPGLFKTMLKHTLGANRYVSVGTSRPGIGGNSQTCLCQAPVPKTLNDRWHMCPACGLSADRDTVSANIAMDIAFGYSNIGAVKPPEPGQGYVRRGEGKRQIGKPVKASTAKSTEPPEKRQPSCDRRSIRNTAGAQATAKVKNLPPLSGAQAPPLSG